MDFRPIFTEGLAFLFNKEVQNELSHSEIQKPGQFVKVFIIQYFTCSTNFLYLASVNYVDGQIVTRLGRDPYINVKTVVLGEWPIVRYFW